MLPNHSPLMVAEQFGTLASLFPDRIDLGLGRAPGTTKETLPALRQDYAKRLEEFPLDVQEIQAYLAADPPDRPIRAIPGAGLDIPIWMLGSGRGGALLAAQLGLPFAYASHFAPDALHEALQVYREHFQCSGKLQRPYVMLTVNLYGADSDIAARRHFTSLQQAALSNQRGVAIEVPPPIEDGAGTWTDSEKADVMHALTYSFVGDARTIEAGLREFIATTRPDELMLAGFFYEHAARIRSLQIAAAVRDRLDDMTESKEETSAEVALE
jgi:luciferase family oxidoreductase group 1